MENTVTDVTPCHQEEKVVIRPPSHAPSEPRSSEAHADVASAAVAKLETSRGDEHANNNNRDPIDNDGGNASKPSSHKVDKSHDKAPEEKSKPCGSIIGDDAAAASPNLKHELDSTLHPSTTATAGAASSASSPPKEAPTNHTKEAEDIIFSTPSPASSSSSPLSSNLVLTPDILMEIVNAAHHGSSPGDNAATAPNAASCPQVMIIDTSSPVVVATNNNITSSTTTTTNNGKKKVAPASAASSSGNVVAASSDSKKTDSKKLSSDATGGAGGTAVCQEQSSKEGGSHSQRSSTHSKKKKKKNKKKKKKNSNPDNHPAKSTESPDQNQKTTAKEAVQDKKSDNGGSAVSPSAKKKGGSSDYVGMASAAAADRPSKAASVAKGESSVSKNGNNKTIEKNDKSNGGADASSRISSTVATKKSETTKEKSDEAKKPDAKDKTKARSALSSPSESSSYPNKKNAAAAPDNQSKADDADDGAWETVEVKTRGRRGKGGGKKSSSGASNNKSSNNKSSNNNNSNNNGGGRNHNNDHGGNHGNNQDGGGNTNHGGGRRRNRRHKGGDKQRNNQHQQTKLVKDVISHILDVVDEEVVRRRRKNGGGKHGGVAKSADEGKRGNGRAGNNEKGSTSNSKHHGQRKQSGGAVPNNPNPSPLTPSIPSSKSLRDVLIGATPAAAPKLNLVKSQAKPPNNVAGEINGSDTRAKGSGSKSESASKGSSKIKPGMSYKSVIEPAKPPAPEPLKPQPAPKPKTKVNAWAKPPVNIKKELALDIDKKINLEPKPSAAPLVQSGGGGVLVPLVPLVADNGGVPPSSADEVIAKNDADVVGASTVVERPAGEEVACQTSDNENDTTAEDVVPSPPLSTLLGPGNSCSASSSVASSLEAPHSSNRFGAHPSSSQAPEDDVGFHLLNVCGQLSEEINTFMSRRALALDVRRKEREAVLCALGDTLGKIWPGQCQVEMYGSCATQLDLPSSDLDLVVCGLDDVINHPPPIGQHVINNFDNSCNSFQEEEVPQECVDASIIQQPGQEQPMSPDQQQLAENSLSSSIHAGGENELVSTPDNQFVEGIVVEGDPGMIQDESANDMLTMEYSPGTGVETYSPEYHESNRQEGAGVAMENYSPGYSYHSNKQEVVAAAENFSPVYAQEEMSMVEGYHGQEYQPNGQEFYYSPYDYVSSLSLNAQRVLRLASELELQPWAVQVKAIPTATVPVVKMLADPSRLPGLAGIPGEDWMMQQHIAAQAGVVAGTTPAPPISPEQISVQNQGSVSPSSHFLHPMAQWRGTDIKNGLQPVDITFEGPEHGGIGSTTYSLHVVDDASKETGLPPESTPVVQVTSVLKELLAQRRLNEPFSGGLSSYGLLMLLLAVVKDRKIIQEEMKKMERQRQKVSDPDNREARRKNNAPLASSLGVEPSDKSSAAPSTTSKPAGSSSWASVAKKSNGSTARTESLSTVTNDSVTTAKTGANYSQVVQKDIQETANIAGQGNDESSAKNYVSGPPNETERLSLEKKHILPQSSNVALDGAAVLSQVTPSSEDDCKIGLSSIPQGNDVFEVLCSGELTSGKLLMHFLLFFGQHFDAQSTLIDILGTHHPDYGRIDRERLSPFVARPPGGTIDPITGMFSVDPIVVYDPLEGAADHNVSKRCYCWNNVRWVFAQCYMTVSSIVESSGTCAKSSSQSKHKRDVNHSSGVSCGDGKSCSIKPSEQAVSSPDVVTPILELLLSF